MIIILMILVAIIVSIISLVFTKKKDYKKAIINGIVACIVEFIVFFGCILYNNITSTIFLTENQLAEYMQFELCTESIVYDQFTSPNDKSFKFIVPDKYLSCRYTTKTGEKKLQSVGTWLKPQKQN